MSTTIGRVDFLVDFDGKKLPAQAKAIGRNVGSAMGREASARFDVEMSGIANRLKKQMQDEGEFLGIDFSNALQGALKSKRGDLTNTLASLFSDRGAFNDFVTDTGDVATGVERLNGLMRDLRDEGGLTSTEFRSLSMTTRNWSKELFAAEDAVKAHRAELEKQKNVLIENDKNFKLLSKSLKKNTDDTKDNESAWKNLSHNLRQAIVIVAAIAAASGEISVLGSAAGAGLTIFGAAAVTAGVGLGVLVAALKGVNGDLSKIPEGARPGVKALQDFGNAFKGIKSQIQVSFFKDLAGPIENLSNALIPTLTTGLTDLASVLGSSFGALFDRLASPEAQQGLATIFDGMEKQLPLIVESIGNIGGAIGNLLIIAAPFVQQFLSDFQRLLKGFEDFTGSVEGNDEIQQWFANGVFIIRKFNNLVAAAGKVLSGLVTPETVKMTANFLDHLTNAMPFIQELLEVFTKLDVFGLIALLLDKVGNALKPVLDLLEPLGQIINQIVTVAIENLATALDFLGILLQPFILSFQIAAEILQPFVDYVNQVAEAIQGLMDPLNSVANNIFEKIKPALNDLTDKILDLLPSPQELARIINEELLPAVEDFADWITTEGVIYLGHLVDGFDLVVDAIDTLVKTKTVIKAWGDAVITTLDLIALSFNKGPIAALQKMIDLINRANKTPLANGNNFTVGGIPVSQNASGGILNGSTFLSSNAVGGESGPEALVPLMRDLNQVDPSVRWLSAVAQGKVGVGGGKSINVDPGAIVVMASPDAGQTADAVLDRLVALTGN